MKRPVLLTTVAGAIAGLLTTMAPVATNAFAATEPSFPASSDGPIYLVDGTTAVQYTTGAQLDWNASDGIILSSIPVPTPPADENATRLPAPSAGEGSAIGFLSPVGSERTRSAWKSWGDVISVDTNGVLWPSVWPSYLNQGAPDSVKAAGGTYSMGLAYLKAGINPLSAPVTKAYYTTINVDAGTGTWKFATPSIATPTTTTLAADKTSVSVGGTVTLTATVTPGDAVGSVEFFDGTSSVGTASVSSGTASKTVTISGAGSHSFTAAFRPGSGSYSPSTSSAVSVTTAKLATTTAISASAISVAANGSVKLTAKVTPTAAAGSVQFYDGAATVGSPVTLASGAASTTISVKPGTHSYTARYTGNSTYAGSTSMAASVTAAAPKKFTRTVKPTISGTARVGKKLTAKVAAWSPVATFSYQWYANGKAIKGATHSTWKLVKAQKGTKITVKVTGARSGYASASLISKATAKVK